MLTVCENMQLAGIQLLLLADQIHQRQDVGHRLGHDVGSQVPEPPESLPVCLISVGSLVHQRGGVTHLVLPAACAGTVPDQEIVPALLRDLVQLQQVLDRFDLLGLFFE